MVFIAVEFSVISYVLSIVLLIITNRYKEK